jgi:hypothetical protein
MEIIMTVFAHCQNCAEQIISSRVDGLWSSYGEGRASKLDPADMCISEADAERKHVPSADPIEPYRLRAVQATAALDKRRADRIDRGFWHGGAIFGELRYTADRSELGMIARNELDALAYSYKDVDGFTGDDAAEVIETTVRFWKLDMPTVGVAVPLDRSGDAVAEVVRAALPDYVVRELVGMADTGYWLGYVDGIDTVHGRVVAAGVPVEADGSTVYVTADDVRHAFAALADHGPRIIRRDLAEMFASAWQNRDDLTEVVDTAYLDSDATDVLVQVAIYGRVIYG